MYNSIFHDFPLGQIVESFRDGRYSWGLARVSGHEKNSFGDDVIITVTFLEDGEVVHFNIDYADKFMKHISKSTIVKRRWRIGTIVRCKRQGERNTWQTGKIVEHYMHTDGRGLAAIVVRIIECKIPFMLDGFDDDGTHERLRVMKRS